MKSGKTTMAALMVLTLALVNVFVLFANATTVQPNPEKKFQVGSWITQGGDVVGCTCGATTGVCVCEFKVTDTRP